MIEGCRALVRGEDGDAGLILVLGGPPARTLLDGQPHADEYWLRVWGLRGLLWVWSPVALPELRVALTDSAWRVREMALKVATRNQVEDVVEVAATLQSDPVTRVRQQANRYLMLVGRDAS